MSFSLQYAGDSIWYGSFSLLAKAGICHGISTRFGGSSQSPYASMNLTLHTGDDPAAVIENRQRFCRALDVDFSRLCTCEQVHGDKIFKVTDKEAGRGCFQLEDSIAGVDALITNEKNLPLLLFFADCTPILIFDPVHQAIGVAHGGWKGTVQKIAAKTIEAMGAEFGTNPADCLVGIGPAIGACCYEVGENVRVAVTATFPQQQDTLLSSVSTDKWKLDLWQANRCQLEDAGVLPDKIDMANSCTQCNADVFFSYRADAGHTGRIGALLCLK